jgi:subtilisin-like proprotein convertase family protein
MCKHIITLILLPTIFLTFNIFAFLPSHKHTHIITPQGKIHLKKIVLHTKSIESSSHLLIESYGHMTKTEIDPLSQETAIITGDLGKVRRTNVFSDYVSHALSYIENNSSVFNINIKDLKLLKESTYFGDDLQFLRFAVQHNKKIIQDAYIAFRYSKGILIQIINKSYANAIELLRTKNNSKYFFSQATSFLKIKKYKKLRSSYRVKKHNNNYVLIPVETYLIHTKDKQSLKIQIQQTNGKIYEAASTLVHYEGSANSHFHSRWYEDPITTIPLAYLNISYGDSFVQTTNLGEFVIPDESHPLIDSLNGRYVKIFDKNNTPIKKQGTLENNYWLVSLEKDTTKQTWLDKDMSQVMIYNHINKIIEHAKKYISPPWFSATLVANSNLNSTCNAHWDGRTINFYQGSANCANTGLIADVIYHEWGHGLDANTGGIEDSAFSEGIGDIVSLLITRSDKLGIGFHLPDHKPVRDLGPDKIYPQDRGEVHAEGLIIGSTFWDLYQEFVNVYNEQKAIDLLSKYIFKGIYTAPTYLDMYQAILVIDDDDQNLLNSTPNKCIINKVFYKHGLSPKAAECQLTVVEGFNIEDSDGDQIIEPGESIKLKLKVRNPSKTRELEKLTATMTSPEDSLVFEKTNIAWEPIAPLASSSSYDAFEFNVPSDTPCGSKINTQISMKNMQQQITFEHSFHLGKNQSNPIDYSAKELPVHINDFQITTVPIDILDSIWEEDTNIEKAILSFKLKHTYVGDLSISLKTPEQTEIPVFRGRGRSDDVNYEQDITALLVSHKIKGTWNLVIRDLAQRDEGSLEQLNLKLSPALYKCD